MRRDPFDRWRALPKKLRDVPINNLRFDADNCDSEGPFGGDVDEYPGETKDRRRAFNAALAVLRVAARRRMPMPRRPAR